MKQMLGQQAYLKAVTRKLSEQKTAWLSVTAKRLGYRLLAIGYMLRA
jgi:hypothetical protein